MKKIIFFIEKSNELKYLAPIISFFKKKKLKIQICFINRPEIKNDFKKYLKPEKVKGNLIKKIKVKKFIVINFIILFMVKYFHYIFIHFFKNLKPKNFYNHN